MTYLYLFLLCYLIGSIPFGRLAGQIFHGIDIREHGSGNIGAANVGRVLGWRLGLSVFLLDFFKGFLIFWLVPWLVAGEISLLVWYGAGLAVILGHVYHVYPFRFLGQGGKGAATSAGVLAVFMPIEVLIAFLVFVLIVLISKWVALGSIVAALTAFISHFLIISDWLASLSEPMTSDEWPLTMLTFIMCVVVIIAHRKNIVRLIKGEEDKFKFKSSG